MKRFAVFLAALLFPLIAQAAVPAACVDYQGRATQCQGVYSTYSSNDVPLALASGNSANAPISLSLPGAANKTTYITGFHCEWGGATGAAEVLLTIASVIGPTTLSYLVIVPAGATLAGSGVSDQFVPPLPANGANQTITLLVPALGAGNLYAACNARGFQR
jgi:hypothetical protein